MNDILSISCGNGVSWIPKDFFNHAGAERGISWDK